MNFTKAQTQEWWIGVVSNPAKLHAWIQKLYQTELSGYTDHLKFLSGQGAIATRTSQILLNIAHDELKHANILSDLMDDWGIDKGTPPRSSYWDTLLSATTNLEEYCAANHFGEDLAAFRFEIISSMPETPQDIKNALRIILPDEQFHGITLEKLAGEDALDRIRVAHEAALATIRK